MQSELKACPFCPKSAVGLFNAQDIYKNAYLTGYAVCCDTREGGCGTTGGYRLSEAEAIAAWNTRAEGDARDAARYRGIRHAMANSDEHFLELLEQHLSQRGLLDHKLLSETEIDSAFDAALKTSIGEGN